MQLNYAMKKWQMFKMMQTVTKNLSEHKRTGIDDKMLQLASKFISEEYLIINYSNQKDIPPEIAREMIDKDKIEALKKRVQELEEQNSRQEKEIRDY